MTMSPRPNTDLETEITRLIEDYVRRHGTPDPRQLARYLLPQIHAIEAEVRAAAQSEQLS